MSVHLAYCVFSERGNRPSNSGIRGVDDAPVYDLFAGGVGAAVSKFETPPSQEIRNLKAYADVVMEYHRHQTVIPMRFGRTVKEKDDILAALRDGGTLFLDRLKAMDGCSEMSIRILAQACREPWEENPPKKPVRPMNGKDFLMARKEYYDRTERIPAEVEEKIESLKRKLAATCKEYRFEHAGLRRTGENRNYGTPENCILASLFFLVPNDCIEKFRRIYRSDSSESCIKTLLSGPWPAYNFVSEIGVSRDL